MTPDDTVHLFLRTSGSPRPDLGLPGLLVLLARGWAIETVDYRYDSFLLGRPGVEANEGEVPR